MDQGGDRGRWFDQGLGELIVPRQHRLDSPVPVLPTAIRSNAERLCVEPGAMGSRLRVPDGATAVRLHGLSGRLVWSSGIGAGLESIDVPDALRKGMLRAVWTRP